MTANITYTPKIKKLNAFYWICISGLAVFLLGIMTIRPVPILPEKDLIVLTGKVVGIYEGGVHDVNLKLEGRDEMFYVNRGLERGLDLQTLKDQLTNQKVTVKYPDHWSLMNFNKSSIHISKIEHQGETIFSEVK